MNAYSEDLRKKIVEALCRGAGKSQTARAFGVSLSSIKRYAKLDDEGWPLAPKKRPGSRPRSETMPGGFWRPTSKSPRPLRSKKDASTSGEWPESR